MKRARCGLEGQTACWTRWKLRGVVGSIFRRSPSESCLSRTGPQVDHQPHPQAQPIVPTGSPKSSFKVTCSMWRLEHGNDPVVASERAAIHDSGALAKIFVEKQELHEP